MKNNRVLRRGVYTEGSQGDIMESDYLIRKKPMQALLIFSLPIILGNLAGLSANRRWRRLERLIR